MSNGTRIRYEHIEDDAQVPRSPDVTENPSAHYIALARLSPTLEWQKMSMSDLLVYLDTALSFAGQMTALERRFNEVIGEVRNAEGENTRQDTTIRNVEGLLSTLQSGLNSLQGRVHALETGGGGSGSQHVPTPGVITYGVRLHDNTVRSQATINYPDLPAAVAITFPHGTLVNDEWFFVVPADAQVEHIQNVGGGFNIDEIGQWTYDSTTRTYAWEGGLDTAAEGHYSIRLTAAPSGGSG